ncbi:hypothetical protein NXC14_CH03553 [Rhizobium sp. NXC14]|nr:hypothetical protein NXC14_CH03553 [Rhizobium sp. NXC14]
MKRTVPPIFCEDGSIAGGAANQENCRLDALFQVSGLNIPSHCTTLTGSNTFSLLGQRCRHGSTLWQCAMAA